MAATRLIPLHVNKGKTAAKSLRDRLDYAQNPEKTEGGELVDSYECDPRLAWQEFTLLRNDYLARHGRIQTSDVIAYQIRQSFKPGEVDPAEANRIGYELAMRFTKGKHAFTVSTHTDRAHIHNHIIFSAITLDGERKFRNFYRSSYALRKLSDTICVEHGLSIIEERPRSEWQRKKIHPGSFALMKDLEQILQQKKGKGYEYWARHFNNTQAAEVLIFLQENGINSREKLKAMADAATGRFHALSDEMKRCEKRLDEISRLRKAIADFVKTRSVYEAYKKSGYSKAFLEANREAITLHQAAKKVFDKQGIRKLPRVKELAAEFDEVLKQKRAAYVDYRTARAEMKTLVTAQKNVSMLLGENELLENVPQQYNPPSREA